MEERVISIPSADGTVCISSSELRELDIKELKDMLLSERPPMSVWYDVLMEYWRLGETRPCGVAKDG